MQQRKGQIGWSERQKKTNGGSTMFERLLETMPANDDGDECMRDAS
jgi:hypothetical protein